VTSGRIAVHFEGGITFSRGYSYSKREPDARGTETQTPENVAKTKQTSWITR